MSNEAQGPARNHPADAQADEHIGRPIVDADDIGFYHARVMQWVALHPDITHTAFRVYAVMRALYIKRRDTRTLSKDQLRYLVPGVNGKPMGRTALADALAVLERFGLITNPDGKSQTWRIRDPETKKFMSQTTHNWVLASLPIEGEEFDGWRNVFDKHDAYRPDWEDNPTEPADVAATHNNGPGEDHDRNSGNGPDPVAEPATPERPDTSPDDESAGQSQRRNSGRSRRNSGSRSRNSGSGRRNSGKAKPVTSANPTPQELRDQEPQDQEQGGLPPSNPPGPTADAVGTEQPGNSTYVLTTEGEYVGNPLHAHARKLAGVPACEAIDSNPDMELAELERIISRSNPQLTQGQVVGRAATLCAWQRDRRNNAAEVGPARPLTARNAESATPGQGSCDGAIAGTSAANTAIMVDDVSVTVPWELGAWLPTTDTRCHVPG